jgi:anti-anti-sigma regulatory factor
VIPPEREADKMMKIKRSVNEEVILALSGRMNEEHIAELERLISLEARGRLVVLDLKELTLAGQDAISFLGRCEGNGIVLVNCARYIRHWITRQRRGS